MHLVEDYTYNVQDMVNKSKEIWQDTIAILYYGHIFLATPNSFPENNAYFS